MGKILDLNGMIFGRLSVLSFTKTQNNKAYWNCLCICGKTLEVIGNDLRSGNTKSCGCLKLDKLKEGRHCHSRKGGMTLTYKSYTDMLTRCRNPKRNVWHFYGGRGITVCHRWQNSFELFLSDMGERPGSEYSIDRIDVNGNYEPGNCRWATRLQQARNRRSCKLIEWNGKKQTLIEWAEELGVNRTTLSSRINTYKWSVEKAFTHPVS